jgi:hypothetical protein
LIPGVRISAKDLHDIRKRTLVSQNGALITVVVS